MKQRNTQPPTEAEVRKQFEGQIPNDAKLMQPDHTTIWALDDGTLLWDWKGGFAQLTETGIVSKTECVIYLSGRQGSGKSTLVGLLDNAVEVESSVWKGNIAATLDKFAGYRTVVLAGPDLFSWGIIERICKQRNIKFLKIKLT